MVAHCVKKTSCTLHTIASVTRFCSKDPHIRVPSLYRGARVPRSLGLEIGTWRTSASQSKGSRGLMADGSLKGPKLLGGAVVSSETSYARTHRYIHISIILYIYIYIHIFT